MSSALTLVNTGLYYLFLQAAPCLDVFKVTISSVPIASRGSNASPLHSKCLAACV